MAGAALLTVVEVPKEDRVLCAACGHSVYRRIHVVRDGAGLSVLGSDCFRQLYGHLDQGASTPRYGTSEGRALTEAERQMLVDNTQRFIDQLEVERLQLEQQELHRRAIEQQEAAQREAADRQRLAALRAAHRRRLRFPDWLEQLTPTEREAFERVRRQVSDAMRVKFSIDPELSGWVGMLNHEARTAFESQVAAPTAATGGPSPQSGDLFGSPDTNASESE